MINYCITSKPKNNNIVYLIECRISKIKLIFMHIPNSNGNVLISFMKTIGFVRFNGKLHDKKPIKWMKKHFANALYANFMA